MNPAVPSARSRPPKPWRTCGRSCASGRRAPDCRVARPSGSGTTSGHARGARVPARPRPRAARRCARDGEDAAGTHPGARPRRQIPAHPVHARFDACRHHRSHAAQRRAGVHLPAGADLRRSRARGRDQPRTGEDAGGAARGDAGAHGHGGRHRAPAVRDLHRVRHAEPRGVRGHLPLPEAELDRFMMKVLVGYPDASAEQGILARTVAGFEADRPATYGVTRLTDAAGLERLRTAAGSVRVEPQIAAYITAVVRGTREAASLTLGASPRAGVSLLKAARAAALLDGRDYVIPDDVKGLAPAVLRHRVNVAPELELEGVTPDAALKAILDKTEVPTT